MCRTEIVNFSCRWTKKKNNDKSKRTRSQEIKRKIPSEMVLTPRYKLLTLLTLLTLLVYNVDMVFAVDTHWKVTVAHGGPGVFSNWMSHRESKRIFKLTVARGRPEAFSNWLSQGVAGVEKYCTKWPLETLCCNLVGWDGWIIPLRLLAPSGALISILTYYWSTTNTTTTPPTFSDLACRPLYNWTLTFWATTAISIAITWLLCWLHVYCIPYVQDSAR